MRHETDEETLEPVLVDPGSMTVAIGVGEMVILPVDCEAGEFVKAITDIPGLEAWPLPDSRVVLRRH